MKVPEEIRNVKRPVNTFVCDSGKNTTKRYAVRARAGSVYKNGRSRPINGNIIGHIIDGKYVPLGAQIENKEPEVRSYGFAAFVKSLSNDILDDLLKVYDANDAYRIMAMAAIRVIKPGISNSRMESEYLRTFVGVYYPGVHLSKNTISTFLRNLGTDMEKQRMFYQLRLKSVMESHHIIIDGTLKTDNSTVNDLSNFSYKSRIKGTKDISLIYAYDVELKEPLCASVYPGNNLDASVYRAFIERNNIEKGMIITDKGFPPSKIKDTLSKRKNLHFLTPLKRNDTRIEKNNMLEFEEIIHGKLGRILCKKRQIQGGNYLYAFKDIMKISLENDACVERMEKNGCFDFKKYSMKDAHSGVIVFESDKDLDLETVYKSYEERWLIELVFNTYKNEEDLNTTRVQTDLSIFGSEFINLISTIITSRMISKLRDVKLLEKHSFGEIRDDLNSVRRKVKSDSNPKRYDSGWECPLEYAMDEMELLGLCEGIPKDEPKKKGRPRKYPVEEKVKKPRGRPRKNQPPL